MAVEEIKYTKKDFASDQEVRWCPGCGDYSILAAVQKSMPEIGVAKEKIVFVSGIGCAARFPYYMNTYGFHTIHGRAPAIASGLKIMNSDLSVWVVSGDGDALSIGGNHVLHTLRRNINLNILLFNNEIYGLTKGQASPTSTVGTISKSSPFGSLSEPVRPLKFALAAGGTFLARTADMLGKHMQQVIIESHAHSGTSFIEILQNCHIFNDGAFKGVLEKTVRDDRLLMLEDGKPMIFGADSDKAMVFNSSKMALQVVKVADVKESDILVHDAANPDPTVHFMLATMQQPFYPVAMGVIRKVEKPALDQQTEELKKNSIAKNGKGNLLDLIYSGQTWKVE